MFELKQEPEIARDKVTAAAGRLQAEIAALLDIGLEDSSLERSLQAARKSIGDALEALLARRRERDERPDTGLQERAQFEAVGLSVKSRFSGDSEAHVIAESLLPGIDTLLDRIGKAREFTGGDQELDRAIERLGTAVRDVRGAFEEMS